MTEPQPVSKDELFASLPPPWPQADLRAQIARENAASGRCIVVLDDDPTGTQTVHDIWVLTRWEVDDLAAYLVGEEPALYILTNSRSLPLPEAQALNREIAANLLAATRRTGREFSVVSRSDSTLRGHFPGEVDALAEALSSGQEKPFDGICLIPFFLEGGRFTVGDVHWVQEGQRLIPAAQTSYARDPAFGYRHSRLPEWVEEKTGGRIQAGEVLTIPLEMLRIGGPQATAERLREAYSGRVIAVNAADERDVEVFTRGVQIVESEGRRFLFRSAASFVKIAAGLDDRPLLAAGDMVEGQSSNGGLVVVGSYLPKSSAQLQALLDLPGVLPVELPVERLLSGESSDELLDRSVAELDRAIGQGSTALLYTSRRLVEGQDDQASLAIGKRVSAALMAVVRRIQNRPRFVIGKGGITSSDLATEGMQVRAARVLGQVHPGVPVWRLGSGSRWVGVPYIVFPGNVGERETLAQIVDQLKIERI